MLDIDPTVKLPYWHRPLYRKNVEKSIEDLGDQANDNGVVPREYRIWVDQNMLDYLQGKENHVWAMVESTKAPAPDAYSLELRHS